MDWKKLFRTPAQRRADEQAEKQRRAEERQAKRAAKKAQTLQAKTPKELATECGEPWVNVLSMDIDPNDPTLGAFELDWNDKFVANLVRAGFQGKTDQDIVDNWFQNVCRNVVLETYEQSQADPEKRGNRRDLGNGRTEVS